MMPSRVVSSAGWGHSLISPVTTATCTFCSFSFFLSFCDTRAPRLYFSLAGHNHYTAGVAQRDASVWLPNDSPTLQGPSSALFFPLPGFSRRSPFLFICFLGGRARAGYELFCSPPSARATRAVTPHVARSLSKRLLRPHWFGGGPLPFLTVINMRCMSSVRTEGNFTPFKLLGCKSQPSTVTSFLEMLFFFVFLVHIGSFSHAAASPGVQQRCHLLRKLFRYTHTLDRICSSVRKSLDYRNNFEACSRRSGPVTTVAPVREQKGRENSDSESLFVVCQSFALAPSTLKT